MCSHNQLQVARFSAHNCLNTVFEVRSGISFRIKLLPSNPLQNKLHVY